MTAAAPAVASTASIQLKFQIGARTLAAIPRRLVRVALSLDDVLRDCPVSLPPLPADAQGYAITSLPVSRIGEIRAGGLLTFVRQRYVRHHTDLTIGAEAWLATLSGSARSGLKRKRKKLAVLSGGTLDVRAYRTAAEFAIFHPLARAVSAMTYQEALLGSGLPDGTGAMDRFHALAAEDRLRAWLLFVDDTPVAYLCCTADGDTLRYDHVGHDPACNVLSPGAVLQVEAMRALFADRFARFDFTEGEGQHKRQFSTGGTACVDLLLLRPTLANRTIIASLGAFDGAAGWAKRTLSHPRLVRALRAVRR